MFHAVISGVLCFVPLEQLMLFDSGFNIVVDVSELIAYFALQRSEYVEWQKDR